MKIFLIIHFLTYFCITIHAQSIGELLSFKTTKTITSQSEARTALKEKKIDDALFLYSESVNKAQENRNSGKGVDGDLLAEYAYTLALHHDYELALMNIDRARALNGKYIDFFSGQVLSLMNYDNAANEFIRNATVPDWIQSVYLELNHQFKGSGVVIQENPYETLKRANRLAANRQTIQSIAMFEELKTTFNTVPIIYVDYSTVWESISNYGYAAQLLKQGIDLMPENTSNRQVFSNHLTKINDTKKKIDSTPWFRKLLSADSPKLMTYIGASAAKDIYSLNGRMGIYTSKKFSASLNFGTSYANEQFSGSIGLSAYKAWGVLFGGMGVTDQFSKDSNTISLTPSVDLTFLNKTQTSSLDIALSGYIPFSKDGKFSYSVSIGKTIYFDFNGLFKK